MNKEIKKIQRDQLDRRISYYNRINKIEPLSDAWIKSLRVSLGMSLDQLAKKLKVTPQSVKEMEDREKEGTISLNILKDIANSLGLKFVYGFSAPKSSLQKIVKKRAYDVAKEIVLRSDKSMQLENQANSRFRIKKAIKERADKIIANQEKILWD